MMKEATGNAEILDIGITCLLENLGTVKTEKFISYILRERADYTKWRARHFENMTDDEYVDAAVSYDKSHPFRPKKAQITI